MKKIGIKRYQKFDTLLSSILGLAIFTMVLKEHDLPIALKTYLMFGTAKQRQYINGIENLKAGHSIG